MKQHDADTFYDELTDFYDLIFEDWEASMTRQGNAVTALLLHYLAGPPSSTRVLDAASGIGTQSIPLARQGFRVSSRDLSAGSIARLQREAQARGLTLDCATADMRTIAETTDGDFDAVLAFDNAVPHLLSDEDLRSAFQSFHRVLRPGGICMISVRDYDLLERGKDSVHPYGIRWRNSVRYLPFQVWHWRSSTHYELDLYVVEDREPHPNVRRFRTSYYAISTARLLELLHETGFVDCERLDNVFYQPVLVGRRGSDAS